jgi:glycosyltransferase involved in cell wall biosynthesis
MRISIIGPALPIPPKGWGAVESLIWDMKLSLNKLGHEVQIINVGDPYQIINMINEFRPDFVHINYDDWIGLYPYIQYPCAVTTHFAYIERPELMGGYRQRVFDQFTQIKPNVFGLSKGINNIYNALAGISKERLYLNPNGVMIENFRFTEEPEFSDRSIYLAKIDHRKRQFLFQSIDSLWYAGNIVEERFDQTKNYLGEWEKDFLYQNLTNYGNLVLLSDGEAHPLVCMEAFAAGLGVVVSQWATANLDLNKKFITVIPEDKIEDTSHIEEKIIENREYSIANRKEILDYAKEFEWCTILSKYYLPNIERIIDGYR